MAWKKNIYLLGICLYILSAQVSAEAKPLKTVPTLDLQLYAGTWYEIALYPNFFQNASCFGTTATYSYNVDGSLKVWNQCYLKDATGASHLERIEGRATVAKTPEAQASKARLKVQFAGPFAGDYWVIALDDNYQYAVVGHPNRQYLWILSRTPEMSEQVYTHLLEIITEQGYDLSKIRRTRSLATP